MNTILIPKELEKDQGYLQSVCTQMIIDNLTGAHKEFHRGIAKVMYLLSIFAAAPPDKDIETVEEILDEFGIDHKVEPISTVEQVIESTVDTLTNMEPDTVELNKSKEGARTDISSLQIISTMSKHRNCIDTVGENMGEILMSIRSGIDNLLWKSIFEAVEGIDKDMALGIERDISNRDEVYNLIYQKANKQDLQTMNLENLFS